MYIYCTNEFTKGFVQRFAAKDVIIVKDIVGDLGFHFILTELGQSIRALLQ